MAPSGRTCLLKSRDGKLVEVDLSDPQQLRHLKDDSTQLLWLDMADPNDDDLAMLREHIGLHELAIEDIEKRRQRPKFDSYPGQQVLVAYEASASRPGGIELNLGELHLILGDRYLVSVHWGASPAVEEVRQRLRQGAQGAEAVAKNVGGLLYTILDTVADGYFPLLDRVSERIDRLQDGIFAGGPEGGRTALRSVLQIKRQLLELRRVVAPLRDVANTLLRRDLGVVDEEMLPYFQDLYDHLVRVLDNLDLYREMLAAALDANLSVTSNNLNVIVKRLTAFTVILMIPTLIAGIYGMNFHFMPELSWQLGYPLAVGAMAVAMIGAFIYFKAHDWF
jgi:magnesium transporter